MVRLVPVGLLLALLTPAPAADPKPRMDGEGRELPREAVLRLGSAKLTGGPFGLAAISPDGKSVLTVKKHAGLKVEPEAHGLTAWDTDTGRKRWAAVTEAIVLAVRVSDDGKSVLVASALRPFSDCPVRFHRLDLETGKPLAERDASKKNIAHSPTVYSNGWMSFVERTEDRKGLAAVVLDDQGKDVLRYGSEQDGAFEHICLAPDRSFVIVTGYGPPAPGGMGGGIGLTRRLSAVSVKTGKEIWSQDVLSSDVVLSHDGKHLYAIAPNSQPGDPPVLRRHEVATGKVLETREVPGADGKGWRNKRLLAPRPDGKVVYVRGSSDETLVVNAESLKSESRLELSLFEGWFSPDGKTVASGGGLNLTLHDLPDGRLRIGSPTSLPKARWPQLQFSPDGKTVTRIGGGAAVTWDVATGKETDRILPAKLLTAGAPHTPLIADIYQKNLAAKSPDGKGVLTYSNPTVQQMRFTLTLRVDGKEWPDNRLTERMVGVLQMAFTPDGRFALAQLDQEHLHIWDLTGDPNSGEVITFSQPGPSGFRQMPLMHPAPDSKRVALVEADPKVASLNAEEWALYRWRLGVYELDTRRRTGGVSGAGVLTAVDWSSDATRIGGGGRHTGEAAGRAVGFAFVATPDGQFVMPPVDLPGTPTACAVSPDGRTLAVGVANEIRLYEVRTGFLRHTFQPSAGAVSALRFHPHNRLLVSESGDGAAFVWDTRGEPGTVSEPDAAGLDRLWADLDSANGEVAFRAIRLVAAHPTKTLPDLSRRIAGQKRPSDAQIAEAVANLTSRLYAERMKAEKELKAMGRLAYPALKAALASDSSAELHARAARVLAVSVHPAAVRPTRLVEAVEKCGTPEAKALLAAWAKDAGPELAGEAEAALVRWRK